MSVRGICFEAASSAHAIGRSNPAPFFRSDAGARFTTIFSAGMENPHALTAERTRSIDSRTAASGMPTTDVPGSPFVMETSTDTATASTPTMKAEETAQRFNIGTPRRKH